MASLPGRVDGHNFSGRRFLAEYHIVGTRATAEERAKLLCVEQTVEAAEHVIPPGPIRDHVLGRVEETESLDQDHHRFKISFAAELLDGSMGTLLHVVFGMAALSSGVRLTDLILPDALADHGTCPHFGSSGLRDLLAVPTRPLTCAVLKPLGLSPKELAALAREFALGGVDMVKDDQGLGDHPFCRFEERVARCVESIADAVRVTGKRCLYAPHISGPWPALLQRATAAQQAGAGALLICPGLIGFDAIALLARHQPLSLPLLSHPDFLGHFVHPDSGIAPSVLFGLLPRLAGADLSIYPTFGLQYPVSQDDCRNIAEACRRSLGARLPIFPTAAGRMEASRIAEMMRVYGRDLVFILGSDLRRDPARISHACRTFIRLTTAEFP